MIPAHGLVPPKLSLKELKRYERTQRNINALLATRKSIQDVTSLPQKVII